MIIVKLFEIINSADRSPFGILLIYLIATAIIADKQF